MGGHGPSCQSISDFEEVPQPEIVILAWESYLYFCQLGQVSGDDL